MKHPWLIAAGLSAVVLTAAALIVVSGIMPIKASSGHWSITARLLDFAKLRSVATHSLGIQAPALDDEALVLRGQRAAYLHASLRAFADRTRFSGIMSGIAYAMLAKGTIDAAGK